MTPEIIQKCVQKFLIIRDKRRLIERELDEAHKREDTLSIRLLRKEGLAAALKIAQEAEDEARFAVTQAVKAETLRRYEIEEPRERIID